MIDVLLIAHIAGGGLALVAGLIALILRKGSSGHRWVGCGFVIAMLVMAVFGGLLAWFEGKPFDLLSSLLVCYLVLSAAGAYRPHNRTTVNALLGLGVLILVGYLGVELYAVQTGVRATEAPGGAGYVFAVIVVLALFGDRRAAGGVKSAPQNMQRHQWRMNFALLMATVSFFGARPHLFPAWMQDSGMLLALSFAPLLVMTYWMVKLRRLVPNA